MGAERLIAPLVKKSVRPDRVLKTLSNLKNSKLVQNIQKHRGTDFEAAAFRKLKSGVTKGWKGIQTGASKLKKTVEPGPRSRYALSQARAFSGKSLKNILKVANTQRPKIQNQLKIGWYII